ncbi:GDSL family lipase [Synechococcus phage S-CRM01]|uniref:GDSL family lipase n=1 Tax=Synechococcus phage S-CRM01 TaxID=1026955 RepID=UPI000209E3F2|nr:GDSL family lipase [Synechococcus phage S-CRM01]AEC53107.1 GDSL family lipase [Synechococcus phage S-CRM01]
MNDTNFSRLDDPNFTIKKLVMDITAHDLNLQMQQLMADYKKTGDEHFKIDAEYLRSEFEAWWNDEASEFISPSAE